MSRQGDKAVRTPHPTVVLASQSPARLRILRNAGVTPHVVVSDVDEDALVDTLNLTNAHDIALALSRAKAEDVNARDGLPHPAVVIGCDSVLAFDGRVLGKPVDADDAQQRWQAMRGQSAVLYSGHWVITRGCGEPSPVGAVGSTTVTFAEVSDKEIEWYVGTGEPLHVAGAFTLDGYGGPFITRIHGDHHNVLGLSLPLLRDLLTERGLSWTDFVSPTSTDENPNHDFATNETTRQVAEPPPRRL